VRHTARVEGAPTTVPRLIIAHRLQGSSRLPPDRCGRHDTLPNRFPLRRRAGGRRFWATCRCELMSATNGLASYTQKSVRRVARWKGSARCYARDRTPTPAMALRQSSGLFAHVCVGCAFVCVTKSPHLILFGRESIGFCSNVWRLRPSQRKGAAEARRETGDQRTGDFS
jgi:hypothetical protein